MHVRRSVEIYTVKGRINIHKALSSLLVSRAGQGSLLRQTNEGKYNTFMWKTMHGTKQDSKKNEGYDAQCRAVGTTLGKSELLSECRGGFVYPPSLYVPHFLIETSMTTDVSLFESMHHSFKCKDLTKKPGRSNEVHHNTFTIVPLNPALPLLLWKHTFRPLYLLYRHSIKHKYSRPGGPPKKMGHDRNIDRSTLRRYIKKKEVKKVKTVGYSGTAEAKRVFTEEVEKELDDHIKKLAEQFHGLTPKKCCELAFQFAQKNNISVPNNWTEKA
ncbi:hypothetical protein FQN60_014834 [Etheostoma spectabile]|uniref:HTH CENPB-type domain-containing protein n=1 Tax=Etheostoma spectabile TaxID=54343 RepID=A0A5J5CSI0_9PERO|nr:hypothetical protein FQN60_014834 [Etheostoma spectabile]